MLTFRKVGIEVGLTDKTLDIYSTYMIQRWKDTLTTGIEYATEWALRFLFNQEWVMSNDEGREILLNISSIYESIGAIYEINEREA